MQDTMTYRLAKDLARILTPLSGQTKYTIMNSTKFVEWLREDCTGPEDLMVSYDVTSLFTQVPIDEALKVVKARRTKDPTLVDRTSIPVPQLVELIELCLRSTYFRFQNNFFEQIEGTCTHGLSPIPRHRQPLHGRSGRTSHAHLNQMSVYQHPIHNQERSRGEACIPGCPDDTQQRPTVYYSV